MKAREQITILLAEDDDGNARLMELGFADAGAHNPGIRFKDGQAAWDFISGKSTPCIDTRKPYLLFLDIHMPNMDGIEVLRSVKADLRFKDMPVIMLTTTDDPNEMRRCHELGCDGFLVKPVDIEELAKIFKLHRFSVPD